MRDIINIAWEVLKHMLGAILAVFALVLIWCVSVASFFILIIRILF